MKSLLLLLTACAFVSMVSSAPDPISLQQFPQGLVDLQQFITQQNRLDTVSDENSFDTSSSNQDNMVTLEQFKNQRGLSDKVSTQEQDFQDNRVEERDSNNNMATHEKRYCKISAQATADDSAALFQALRLAAVETMPEQTREKFWRAAVHNVIAQRG